MSSNTVEFISRISELLSSASSRVFNFNPILEQTVSQLEARRAFLLIMNSESGKLAPIASAGLTVSEFRKLEARSDTGLFRRAFDDSRSIVVENAADAEGGDVAGAAKRTMIAAPIKAAGKTVGVIAAEFSAATRLRAEKEKTLALVGALIAQSLRVQHAVLGERQKLIEENSHLRQELKEKYEFTHIIGNSNAMKIVYDQVTQVARSNATVLLRGESGTGKEMIANAIHYNSLRSKRPLIKINCAALPDTLIEAELFGYEKGAFTGAERTKKGRFELADGGTLFLDEIGDLPLQTQIKLLRVLQEREFERLGGVETLKSNIRLIAATNKNLEEAIARGEFREDLYYRLNVFSIFLPPLRERKSDILLLAEHFLEKYEAEHGKRIRRISTPAIDMLMSYHFPGNVRELENAIERAVLVCDANVIHGHHLPLTLQTAEISGTVTDLSLAAAVAAFERGMIQDALKSTKGNASKAAKMLDSTERILGYKIKKYGIDAMRFRK